MKKIVFVFTVLAISCSAFSQVNKGQWLVGGTAGFESSKFGDDDDSKVTSITFSPNAGYFLVNNFAAGVRLSINSVKEEGDEDAFTTTLVAPFARYYFLPAEQKVNVFADASYGFGSMKAGDSESFNQFTVAAGPAVFLSPNTALEFTLQYRSQGGDAFGGDDRMNSFGLNVGFQVHLGK